MEFKSKISNLNPSGYLFVAGILSSLEKAYRRVSAAKNYPSLRATRTQDDFSPAGGNLSYLLAWLAIPLLGFLTIACNSSMTDLSLEGQIREYLYKYQPTTGTEFVEWTNQNLLPNYSARQIYIAMNAEGKFQAELGHPNVVGVLSFASRSWAKQNKFQYNPDQWLELQQLALSNLRSTPQKVQLWPNE